MKLKTKHGFLKKTLLWLPLSMAFAVFIATALSSVGLMGCSVRYGMKDISIPDSIKTIKINFIQNKATYINPQLAARLTDKLRNKIISQTKLIQTNNDNADWEVDATITGYFFTTSGISQQNASTNRLSITLKVTKTDHTNANKKDEYDVNRNFEFNAQKSTQAAESELADEIDKTITEDIFNRLFSNW